MTTAIKALRHLMVLGQAMRVSRGVYRASDEPGRPQLRRQAIGIELSEKYQALGTAAQRTAFVMDVFGRGGTALIPLLSLTGTQLDEVARRAKDLETRYQTHVGVKDGDTTPAA